MNSTVINSQQQESYSALYASETGFQLISSMPKQDSRNQMSQEVFVGLNNSDMKSLPCTYFYDQHGSQLYELITEQPEYYPTRTEAMILKEIAPDLAQMLGPMEIVELGSGSAAKTRTLLDAWQSHQYPVTYIPMDVSESILYTSGQALTEEYPDLRVIALAGQYEDCLKQLPQDRARLFLFLGGTLGNFTPVFQRSFFKNLIKHMGSGSQLLLGFDRRPHSNKSVERIIQAYNDSQGVTARFNLNILSHINTRLNANFDLSNWTHRAIYNQPLNQIEMYLDSSCFQTVCIGELEKTFTFEAGESILTEISRKFDPVELADWFKELGYQCTAQWTDPNQLFGMMLLKYKGNSRQSGLQNNDCWLK